MLGAASVYTFPPHLSTILKPSAWHGKSLLNLLHAIFQEPGLQCFHGFMHCEMQELEVVHVSACKIHKHPLIPGFHNPNMVSIKAKYGGYIIKFMLSSLSSRLVQLHEEVAKRLNLEAGTYHVVYEDEEDDNILIACDEDLQLFMRTSRYLGST